MVLTLYRIFYGKIYNETSGNLFYSLLLYCLEKRSQLWSIQLRVQSSLKRHIAHKNTVLHFATGIYGCFIFIFRTQQMKSRHPCQ